MSTLIPVFVLALLGNPPVDQVITTWDTYHNEVCWASKQEARCFYYSDEGSHIVLHLNVEIGS